MSRIGRMPVVIPSGVTVEIAADDGGAGVTVKGPKGALNRVMHPDMTVKSEDGKVTITRPTDEKRHKALHGLTRTLINNMVVGVTDGFSKTLEIDGVGWRAQKQGKSVVFNIGYSHPVTIEETPGITFDVPAPTQVVISGADKQRVGQIAAEIRKLRLPEPYLGHGIKYAGERIRRKAGKAGKK